MFHIIENLMIILVILDFNFNVYKSILKIKLIKIESTI